MRRLRGRQQEHRGLEALFEDGEKGHGNQRQRSPAVKRLLGFVLEFALEPSGVAVHPDDHGSHKHHGDGVDDGLHHLLLRLRQSRREQVQADAHPDTDQHGQANTGKHRTGRLAVSLEEGADDADDERRLQAFTQPDEEGAQKNAEYALHAPDSRPADRDLRVSLT